MREKAKIKNSYLSEFSRSLKALAREIDVPQQTLQRIVAGLSPNPHRKTLVPLAKFFSISVDQLTGKKPLPDELSSANVMQTKLGSTHQPIPLVPCSDVERYLQNRDPSLVKEYLVTNINTPSDAFATVMDDSSMEPYIPQGAVLILDAKKSPQDRGFILVKLRGNPALVFRQVLIDGENRYLKPMNPDLAAFSMRLLREEDCILGVLLELRHRYNH